MFVFVSVVFLMSEINDKVAILVNRVHLCVNLSYYKIHKFVKKQ